MCGLAGIISSIESDPARAGVVASMAARLAHRGPDASGTFEHSGLALAHRRLVVVDPSDAARQPMRSPDGRCVLVYNGELYNDAELRSDLGRLGVTFATSSDTLTMLMALQVWGERALERVRGMFSLCFVDLTRRVAILARDPLGIKPLYFAELEEARGESLVFASEPGAMLECPGVSREPDDLVVAAYLSTLRTTLGERTLLRDVSSVEPGGVLRVSYGTGRLNVQRWSLWDRLGPEPRREADAAECEALVRESVVRHRRADVPLCALLSGGLDSTIIVSQTLEAGRGAGAGVLKTYCSGAKGGTGPGSDDFAFARLVAERFGTTHQEVPVTPECFERSWDEMVTKLRWPLSTPNEVAIREVCRSLRSDGHVVALSGEGADELFGGYDLALRQSALFCRGGHPLQARHADLEGGEFELLCNAWLSPDGYADVLEMDFLERIDRGEPLRAWYRRQFEIASDRASAAGHDEPLQAHMLLLRRVNLSQLLARLDTSSMLEGVEGRTPLADLAVARYAESLAMDAKFVDAEPRRVTNSKILLRRAFGPSIPSEVVAREKASFPLPFAQWLGSSRRSILESERLRTIVRETALQAAASNPSQYWHLAWPLANLCKWFAAIGAEHEVLPDDRAQTPEAWQ